MVPDVPLLRMTCPAAEPLVPRVRDAVGVIVTAPENEFELPPNVPTPVEVLNAPVLPLKSFAPEPAAVKPPVIAPPIVTAPVEVLNVPVEPEKSFAAEPEAVKPVAITGLVSVVFEIVCAVVGFAYAMFAAPPGSVKV